MLVITCRFPQLAALVFKMDVSCSTTQQIVYKPADVPSSVSISGSESVSFCLSWAYATGIKDSARAWNVFQYPYCSGKLTIWEHWAPALILGTKGGVPGRCGIGSGVGSLRRSGGGAPVPLHLQSICGFFAVPFWQGRHPSVWFWRSVAGSLSIAATPFYAAETHHATSSLLALWRKVAWSDTAFSLLQRTETIVRPGRCRTVPAIHDLLAVPQ